MITSYYKVGRVVAVAPVLALLLVATAFRSDARADQEKYFADSNRALAVGMFQSACNTWDSSQTEYDRALDDRKAAADSYAANSGKMTQAERDDYQRLMGLGDDKLAYADDLESDATAAMNAGGGRLADGDVMYAAGDYAGAKVCYSSPSVPPPGAYQLYTEANNLWYSRRQASVQAAQHFRGALFLTLD